MAVYPNKTLSVCYNRIVQMGPLSLKSPIVLILYLVVPIHIPLFRTSHLKSGLLISGQETDYQFPESFKTKLTFYHQDTSGGDEKQKIDEWYNNGMFRYKSELDEYYDSKRKLGKLVIRNGDGSIVELFVRPLEGYYVVHKVGEGCSITKYRQEEFRIFDYLDRLLPDQKHLFGPSAIVFKWQKELAATSQIPTNSGDVFDHRLVESQSGMLDYKEKVGEQNATVIFLIKRTGTPIKRSKGLSHYATRALIREVGNFIQYFEFISFDQLTSVHDLYDEDPFKLPTGIGCVPDDSTKYLKFTGGNRFSGHFVSSFASFKKNFIAVDGKSQLMRHDADQSTNVYDLERSLVYHMPNDVEPIARQLSDNEFSIDTTSEHQVNGECFLFSMRSLFKPRKKYFTTGIQLLTGTDYMYYMGRSTLRGSLVHVFERIISSDSDLLPFVFQLLPQQRPCDYTSDFDKKSNDDDDQDRIYVTLYIAAVASCDYYTEEVASSAQIASDSRMSKIFYDNECDRQLPVGVRAVRHRRKTNSYQLIDEISIFGANWQAQKSTENPLTIFDIGRCPLERTDFSTMVTWSDGRVTLPNDRSVRILSLPQAVANKVSDYFKAPPISVSNIVVRYHSSDTAQVAVSLLDSPMCYPSYQMINREARLDELSSPAVRTKKDISLLECLMVAAQYNSVRSLLYTSKRGSNELDECILLNTNTWSSKTVSEKKEESDKTYYLFYKIRECWPSYSTETFDSKKLYQDIEHTVYGSTDHFAVFMEGIQLNDIVLASKGMPVSKLKILSTRIINQQPMTITRILSGYRYDSESDYKFVTMEDDKNNDKTVLSLAYCINECDKDTHCSSLAFCREDDENLCLISNIKNFSPDVQQDKQSVDKTAGKKSLKMHLIGGHQLRRDSRCEIHIKNYMEYFDAMYGTVATIESITNWRVYDHVKQANICAKNCIEIQENSVESGQDRRQVKNDCLLFVHCRQLQECLVRIENPSKNVETSHREDLTESIEQSSNLTRRYNRFDCTTYKYKNKFLYVPIEQRLKNSIPFVSIKKYSLGGCSERCAFEADCVSFDLCQVITEKMGNHDIPEKITSLDCHLHNVSIYDDNIYWNNDKQELDEWFEGKMKNEERLISRNCKHYERKQAFSIGRQLSQIKLERLDSSNSIISNSLSILAAAFIGICLGLLIGTGTRGSKNDERYRGSLDISYTMEGDNRRQSSASIRSAMVA